MSPEIDQELKNSRKPKSHADHKGNGWSQASAAGSPRKLLPVGIHCHFHDAWAPVGGTAATHFLEKAPL